MNREIHPMPRSEFWNGKRVLITGHTGFKGGWLSLWLTSLGAKICGISLDPPYSPNFYNAVNLRDQFAEDHRVDIRDLDRLRSIMTAFDPDIVFHLAAQPLVRKSYEDPIETYSTNVMGTAHVLEICRQLRRLRAVVVVTTDKCYENKEQVWGYRESDTMGGHDPYSSSKGCAELLTSAYYRSFFAVATPQQQARVGIATARAGNVIGGGDWSADRLVPDLIRAMRQKSPLVIRNPRSTRPWQHVLEPIRGYMILAEKCVESPEKYSGGWNFGPNEDDCIPVGDFAEIAVNLWGDGASWVTMADSGLQPHEANLLRLECSKVRAGLGWRPMMSIQTAIRLTIEWYKAANEGVDMLDVSLQQIRTFASREIGVGV